MSAIVLAVMLFRGRVPGGWRLLAVLAVAVDLVTGIRAIFVLLST